MGSQDDPAVLGQSVFYSGQSGLNSIVVGNFSGGIERDIEINTEEGLFPLDGKFINTFEFHGFSSFFLLMRS
jgi:hypothetical protein